MTKLTGSPSALGMRGQDGIARRKNTFICVIIGIYFYLVFEISISAKGTKNGGGCTYCTDDWHQKPQRYRPFCPLTVNHIVTNINPGYVYVLMGRSVGLLLSIYPSVRPVYPSFYVFCDLYERISRFFVPHQNSGYIKLICFHLKSRKEERKVSCFCQSSKEDKE